MRVLVIEDDRKIAGFTESGLKEQGFSVDVCFDGDEGFKKAVEHPYDVIILDIMLPGRDGLSILKNLREQKRDVPVILVTARSALSERLEGLNLGADDYVSKPFYVEELIARIHAVARRGSGERSSLLQADDLKVDLLTREVLLGGQLIDLSTREFSLLEYLMRSPGRVFTRTQILEHVWGYDFDPQTNIVDVYIQRIRKKLAEVKDFNFIETVRGVGYRFVRTEND